MRTALLCLLLPVLALAQTAASPPPTPHLIVSVPTTTPRNTLATFDTLFGVTGVPFDTKNRRVATAVITWHTSNTALVVLADASQHGQRVTLVGTSPGTTTLTATWKRTDGVTLHDSATLIVAQARVVKVSPFFSATLDRLTGRIMLDTTAPEGLQRIDRPTPCLYAAAYDRRGGVLTGRPLQERALSTDAISWRAVTNFTSPCPDTSVDPARLAR